VEDKNWKGKENGELLLLVGQEFDAILTADASIAHQNPLGGRKISIVVVPTNRWTLLVSNADSLRLTLDEIEALDHHVLVVIDWKGRRTMRRLDRDPGEEIELAPVPAFGT
jgi:hypothetical protein